MRDALNEEGWKLQKKNDLDACVEWMVVDFEFGETAADISFNNNINGELSRKHFGHREWLVSDKRGFDSVTKKMFGKLEQERVILN